MILRSEGKTYFLYNLCDNKRIITAYDAQSTSNAIKHLKHTHQVTKDGNACFTIPGNDVLVMQETAAKRQKIAHIHQPYIPKTKADGFRSMLVQWIVCMHIAFSAVESKLFRVLFEMAETPLLLVLPHSGNPVRNWILEDFKYRKREIKRQLREESLSMIHILFDLRTSCNHLAILGVVAHYMDTTHTVQTRLIGLRRLKGPHSGENMAQILIELFKEYEITNNLGYFILDNASSNDTCVEIILSELTNLTFPERQARRLRCWGNILTLGAQSATTLRPSRWKSTSLRP